MAWATLLGFLLWGEVPSPAAVTGIVAVCASGLHILHRDKLKAA